MTSTRTTGLTLIEVLVVISIVGILMGIMSISFTKFMRNNQVMDAARSFAGDLLIARSAAQKSSTASSLSWTVSADQPILSYTLTLGATTSTHTPASGISVTCLSATGGACTTPAALHVINYTAPYGEADQGAVFKVAWASDSSIRPLYVKVGGLTGKVIFSASQD